MSTEHEATALRVEHHGKRDYFYAGDEYIGEVNKVSFNFGHDTGEVFATAVNAHATTPDARKCPFPNAKFEDEHEWSEPLNPEEHGEDDGVTCDSCGMSRAWLTDFAKGGIR